MLLCRRFASNACFRWTMRPLFIFGNGRRQLKMAPVSLYVPRLRPAEWLVTLRVFGCLPNAGARGCTEAGVRKASREETAGPAWVERRGAMELWGFESRGQSAATSGS